MAWKFANSKKRKWSKVTFEPNTGCWVWYGSTSDDGYGKCTAYSYYGECLAHRAAYVEKHGPIPEGLEIDHLCRVRCCVNPDHLEAVTHETNIKRGDYKPENHRNTRKTHCKRGHSLEGNNLVIDGGARKCKKCRRDKMIERIGGLKGYRGPATVNLYCKDGHPMFGPDLRFRSGARYCWRCASAACVRSARKRRLREIGCV